MPRSKRAAPKPEPPPPRPGRNGDLDADGRWWIECYERLARFHGRAPSINEIARYVQITTTPVHRKLSQLEAAGYFTRDAHRHFVRTGRQP